MTDPGLKRAALDLATVVGWAVFPCTTSKAPATPRGFYDATTDPDTIESWTWDGMIGVALPPGHLVIDVDPRNGGDATMEALRESGRTMPETLTARTGGGGLHYYLRVDDSLTLRGKLGPGVDVKRSGKGYVIAPPSPGYSWVGMGDADHVVAPAPDWLIDELEVTKTHEVGEAHDPKYFTHEGGTPYGLAALERELGRLLSVPEGGRNDALNRSAFALAQIVAGGELDPTRARDGLDTVAPRLGLDVEEARATIESGWGAGLKSPRQAKTRDEDSPTTTRREDEVVAQDDGLPRDPEAEAHYWLDWDIEEEEPPFLCHPILPANAYVMVYGSTEASKSMSWMGILADGSRLGYRSSIYSLENPAQTERSRLRKWGPDPANLRLTTQPLDFNDPRQVQALVDREKDWGDGRGADVIMIDTYSHAFNSRSEDGNAKAIEFARRVRHVMHEVGCSVIVLDHTGFSGDEPRDASAKRQQVDVAILMTKNGEWRPGEPSRFTMKNRKAARFSNPFHMGGEIVDVPGEPPALALNWSGETPRWEDR